MGGCFVKSKNQNYDIRKLLSLALNVSHSSLTKPSRISCDLFFWWKVVCGKLVNYYLLLSELSELYKVRVIHRHSTV